MPRLRAHVETIAGWCLRYVSAYPNRSGYPPTEPSGAEWNAVYQGAVALVNNATIRAVIASSYSCLLVDEYQDCTPLQHRLVSALAEILSCRVLGDPLQGIFGFAGANLSWKEVEAAFPPLGELTTPWRWKGRNDRLGSWLLEIRPHLIAGRSIDLSAGPIRWATATTENQRAIAYSLLRAQGQVVAIRKWDRDAHSFARTLAGAYPSMEEVDCKDLLTFSADLDRLTGVARAGRVVEFAAACFTTVSSELETIRAALRAGRAPDLNRIRKHRPIAEALVAVARVDDASTVLSALRLIAAMPGAQLFRPELWWETKRTLVEFEHGKHATLHKTAWAVRNRTRSTGRPLGHRLVSRTLLIKGLEFDHALVLDANEFADARRPDDGAKHFYVSVTRGSHSLTVLSAESSLQFKAPTL